MLQLYEIDINASIACLTAQKVKSEAGLPTPDVVCQKDSQDVLHCRDRDEPFFGATSRCLELKTKLNIALPSQRNSRSSPIIRAPPHLYILHMYFHT
jgi:hypothetical protein